MVFSNWYFRAVHLNSKAPKIVLAIVAGGLMVSCSNQATPDAESSGVTISGSLALASSSGYLSKPSAEYGLQSMVGELSVSDYKIQCTSIDDSSKKVTGAVNSDGTFSLPGVPANAIGCQILDSSDTSLAPIVFSDDTEKDMKGKSKTKTRVQLTDSADIGSVSYNSKTKAAGATISTELKAKINSSTAQITSPYDFTGSYKMAKFDGELPSGYSTPCAAGEQNCYGPSVDEPIYIKVITGKAFSPDSSCQSAAAAGTIASGSTCNGTTSSDNKYGISIWKSQAAYAACGSKLGFYYVEGKAYGQIDLSSSGVTEGSFNWSTNGSGGSTISEGWKFSTAETNREMPNCEPTTVGSGSNQQNGYKCYDNVSSPASYQVNLAKGGCVGSDGNPVSNINWSQVSYGSSSTSAYDVTNFPGYIKNTQNATYNGQPITCEFVYGTFRQDNNASLNGSGFNWNNVTKTNSGTLCSAMPNSTNKEKLAQLQCYSEALWNQNSIRTDRESDSLCLRKVRANWGATDPEKFLVDSSGPQKAESQHVLELLDYTSNDSATFRMRDDDYRGVQNGNGWATCHLEQAITISLKKRSDGNLNIEFISETKNLDAAVAACKSSESSLGVGTTKFMFKAVKQ